MRGVVEFDAPILEYASPSAAKPTPFSLRCIAAGISILAIVIVFLDFAYGVSPWEAVVAPGLDWEVALIGSPFLLAFPLFWLSIRLLVPSTMFRFELAIIWLVIALLTAAAIAFDGTGIYQMIHDRSSDGVMQLCVSMGILLAGALILFLNRGTIDRQCMPAMVGYIAYVANAVFCILNFDIDQNIGWILTIVISCLMGFQITALLLCRRTHRLTAST